MLVNIMLIEDGGHFVDRNTYKACLLLAKLHGQERRSLNKEIHATMGHLSNLLEAFKRAELFIQGVITVELYGFK